MIRDEVKEIGNMGELEGENTERVSQVGKLKVPDFDIICITQVLSWLNDSFVMTTYIQMDKSGIIPGFSI